MYNINNIKVISSALACLMVAAAADSFATPDISQDLPGSTFMSATPGNPEGLMESDLEEGEVVRDPAFGLSEQACDDVEDVEGCSELAMYPPRARLHF
jgi:hypothetical protein